MTPDRTAVDAIAAAAAEAPGVRLGSGGGRGVVTCGGGPYSYGIYVLAGMLRRVGYDGPIQAWHRGRSEPMPAAVLRPFGVEVVDASAVAGRSGSGWSTKAVAVSRCPFDTVLFLDADAYPVTDPTPWFEEAESEGQVFWPDTPNDNLRWAAVGVDPAGAPPPTNGGQWVVCKKSRAGEVRLYAALNARHRVLHHLHLMFGDQDCQRLAWHLTGAGYGLGTRGVRQVGPSLLFTTGGGAPAVVHRVNCKLAPAGCFPGRSHANPIRGLPSERQALALYREAVDAIGVPGR